MTGNLGIISSPLRGDDGSSEDPTPAQKPLFESASQVTDYKTQKIYDSNAHKELRVNRSFDVDAYRRPTFWQSERGRSNTANTLPTWTVSYWIQRRNFFLRHAGALLRLWY
jgi:hypothetical protein